MADDHDELRARVRALEDTLLATQARLDHLLADLSRTRAGGFRAMRDARQCPACGGRALFHVRRLREASHDGRLDLLGLSHEERWLGNTTRAPLEAMACRTCHLVELHAVNFDGLVADGDRVVALDPEPEPPTGGPFR
jgi:hypothetical protein